MNTLALLTTTALLGTDRLPPEWPAQEGALGTLLGRIPREAPEKAVLLSAGVLGTCHLAGWLPPQTEGDILPAPDDAVAPDPRAELLAAILADGPDRLQAEALQGIAALPHSLLPAALECGRRNTALRPFLLPVLGNRGLWLARQNEAWSYAVGVAGTSDDVWNHGSLDQRTSYLQALRRSDPTKARELIAAAMTSEGAKERTAFIGALGIGLAPEDESLLEATLPDKSKEARQSAARLLSALPESRYSQRMVARVRPLLKGDKKWGIEAPLAFEPAWKADLIEEARPKGHSMGDRAWWLFQMVRHMPLHWWETHLSMAPAALLEWAQKSDWAAPLMQGWADAQAVQRRMEWADAFLGTALPPNGPLTAFDLLETIPPALREPHFLRLLDVDAKTYIGPIIDRFVQGMPMAAPLPLLSHATAIRVLHHIKERIHSGAAGYDWQLRSAFVNLACLLPISAFAEAVTGWQMDKAEAQSFADAITRASIVLDQRKQLQLSHS